MIQKLKRQILVLSSALMLILPAMVPVAVYASGGGGGGGGSSAAGCTGNITSGVANGASAASGTVVDCNETGGGGSTINALAQKVVNIFSILVGGVAVIMIIYGGFRYITSGGDSGNVGNAKNTLIYAVVGLVIVALAQIIVHFVLSQSTQASTGL